MIALKKITVLFFAAVGATALHAQLPPDVCETKVPLGWTTKGGSLTVSDRHFKAGKESVRWDWNSNAALQIKDAAFESVAANPRSSFVIWIYNEKPVNDSLAFRFGKDGKTAASFRFHLNFQGWRTAWVMYHRDMAGKPVADMNELAIEPPKSVNAGSLFFDRVLYNVTLNPRSPMQDEQVPLVNIHSAEAANAHWTALYKFSHIPHSQPLPPKVTEADIQAIQTITQRFQTFVFPSVKKMAFTQVEEAVKYWNIRRNEGVITGRPVLSVNDAELLPEDQITEAKKGRKERTVKDYSELMLKVASAYSAAKDEGEKARLGQWFIDMLDHLEDQGWAAGSGMGALHHLGYNFRDYYTACLLMRPLLKTQKRLQRIVQSMEWFSGLGRTHEPGNNSLHSNIDVFNTLLNGMLSTVLMMDDSPAKIQQLREFSTWLSGATQPTFSIDGTFKPDGAVVHHGNLYPAYGVGGLQGVAPIIYALSQTPFRVKEKGHETVRRTLLMMHRYTNPYRWPLGVSGRHPTGNWSIADEAFAYMALAGTPEGSKALDDSMAAIYLLLNPTVKNDWTSQFRKAGINNVPYPNGHWDINYGLLSIHRRSNWLLTIRGHNRYFTTHEAYPGANVFGRYLSYGQLEVLYPQTEVGSGSNFKDEGWDWNSIPGTTTLKVPLDSLRARVINADDYSGVEEMLLSDEIFAGGINLNGQQGAFAMKLHGHDKYNMGSFRAIKSYFMFDSLVVCLGSNISNTLQNYPTVTTLFQNVLDSSNSGFYLNGESTTAFPVEKAWADQKRISIIDNRGIGYYLPVADNLRFAKGKQTSRNQQDTKVTSGDVGLLQISHGNAPKNSGYEYAMLMEATPQKMQQLQSAQQTASPVYGVVQKDSVAHIVHYAPKDLTGLVLFSSGKATNDKFVKSNNRPCLLMYQPSAKQMTLSVVDPDLAFYSGPDDSPRTPDGKRKEVSIYSRSWYETPSKPSVVELEVKGRWGVKKNAAGVTAKALPNGNTRLHVPCKYGLTTAVTLKPNR